jgi:hypothetical protein
VEQQNGLQAQLGGGTFTFIGGTLGFTSDGISTSGGTGNIQPQSTF